MRRPLACAALAVAALGVAPTGAGAARGFSEGFSRPLAGWQAGPRLALERVRVAGDLRLRVSGEGSLWRPLPRRWALSMDLALERRTRLLLGLGDGRHPLVLGRGRGRSLIGYGARRLRASANPRRGRWLHLEARAERGRVVGAVGGRRFVLRRRPGARLSISPLAGGALLDDLLATRAGAPAGLLLHRLVELQARVPPRRFLVGAGPDDRLHMRGRTWTRGFLAGALWQADAIAGGDVFRPAALARSLAARGYEDADSHDLGFVYESSAVTAFEHVCRRRPERRPPRLVRACRLLEETALSAADRLMDLAASNPGGGTIPTHLYRPSPFESDTIVDSLMNLPLIEWASARTGDPYYREVADRHARRLVELLMRPDGSTAQSVHMDRATGRVLKVHTHQGLSGSSAWARGQGWAVYGLTRSAATLGDPVLLAAAERAAAFVADHLPELGVPRWDYSAGPGAPTDVSAGAVTAAGLYRLAALCRRRECLEPGRWRPLADRMLAAVLARVSTSIPLGYLGGQVGTLGGRRRWDDDAEPVYGLDYALEAVRLRARLRA